MCDELSIICPADVNRIRTLLEKRLAIAFALDRWPDIDELVGVLEDAGYRIVCPLPDGGEPQ